MLNYLPISHLLSASSVPGSTLVSSCMLSCSSSQCLWEVGSLHLKTFREVKQLTQGHMANTLWSQVLNQVSI